MNSSELIEFEREVGEAFKKKKIRGPVHLAGGNEQQLIEIFKQIKPEDWVLSTWRSHYHALLKGVPKEQVLDEILGGRSMSLHFPEYKFLTSAIVGGIAPIATGLAFSGERVWCFIGDAAAKCGVVLESICFAEGHDLPITFIIEDNSFATNSPTEKTWGTSKSSKTHKYVYVRTTDHCGIGEYVSF